MHNRQGLELELELERGRVWEGLSDRVGRGQWDEALIRGKPGRETAGTRQARGREAQRGLPWCQHRSASPSAKVTSFSGRGIFG